MGYLSPALAITHHLLVFGLISILFGEYTILKFSVDQSKVVFLRKMNYWYTGVLLLVLLVGCARVFYGDKPSIYYLHNDFFWIKIAALVTLLIYAFFMSKKLHQWQDLITEQSECLTSDLIDKAYRMVFIQMHLFPIPVVAAVFMARGI